MTQAQLLHYIVFCFNYSKYELILCESSSITWLFHLSCSIMYSWLYCKFFLLSHSPPLDSDHCGTEIGANSHLPVDNLLLPYSNFYLLHMLSNFPKTFSQICWVFTQYTMGLIRGSNNKNISATGITTRGLLCLAKWCMAARVMMGT